jgi:hypothetical protein
MSWRRANRWRRHTLPQPDNPNKIRDRCCQHGNAHDGLPGPRPVPDNAHRMSMRGLRPSAHPSVWSPSRKATIRTGACGSLSENDISTPMPRESAYCARGPSGHMAAEPTTSRRIVRSLGSARSCFALHSIGRRSGRCRRQSGERFSSESASQFRSGDASFPARNAPVNADGEIATESPARFTLLPGAVRVYSPQTPRGELPTA